MKNDLIFNCLPNWAIVNGDTANIVKENNLSFISNLDNIDSIKDAFIQEIEADQTTLNGWLIK